MGENGERRPESEILANEAVPIRLGSVVTEFREPGRRRARQLLRHAEPLYAQMMHMLPSNFLELDEGGKEAAFAGLDQETKFRYLDMLEGIQDYVYEACGLAPAQRETADDEATEAEIGQAFAAILEVLSRPFANSPAKT
jgi:hypothetical protein